MANPTTDHVFRGPSITAERASELLPGACLYPPIRHGDLLRADIGPGDRVVILDGVFQQSASVRHKEITEILARGVAVWGAASMGALRAAELGPHGVVGAGTVHRLYALGVIERDDEVALVHTDDEESRALTAALVSVRVLARRLARTRRLATGDEAALVRAAEGLPFYRRTWTGLLQTAAVTDAGRDAVRAALAGGRASWDVKARDAERLLRFLAGRTDRGTPPAGRATPRTIHLERWVRSADPSTERLVTAASLYVESYPDVHRDVAWQLITGASASDGDSADLRRGRAAAAIRAAGLVPRHEEPDETLRRLARTARPRGGLRPTAALARALPPVAVPELTRVVDRAEQLNASLARRGREPSAVSRTALLTALEHRWRCGPDGLLAAAAERGYRSLDELVEHARWFGPQLLLDPPDPISASPIRSAS